MTDRYRPTNATAEGQMITLVEGVGKTRAGKVFAWVVLLAMLAFGIFLGWSVLSA